jgi:glycosyltransferase involved in cell wall biosynthesis
MRILSISHVALTTYDFSGGFGGAAFQKPTSELIKMGCDVQVIAPVPLAPFPINHFSNKWLIYSNIPMFEKIEGVNVFHPRYLSFPKAFMSYCAGYLMFIGIKKLVRSVYNEKQFDLIHAHNVYPDGYAGLLLSLDYQKPLIVSARGTDLDITAERNKLCVKQLKSVLTQSKAVIAPSPRLSRTLKEKFGLEGVNISNGIDVDEIDLEGANEKQRDERIVLLSACTLIRTKGIDLNLKALKILTERYRNLIYYIIGDGPEKNNLQELVRALDLENYVEFCGTLTHGDVLKYMAKCNIFTMPSWQETFGLVYLEAMASGKPVIGCKGQGMDNIILDERVGLLAEPKDVTTLVQALDFLINNPNEAAIMGLRGRKLVIDKYTHKKNAELTMKLYQKILN